MKSSTKKQLFFKNPLIVIIVICMLVYSALLDDSSIHEGKVAVFHIILRIVSANIVAISIWIFFVIGVIKDKKGLNRSFFMSGFYIVLISIFFAFFITSRSISGYYVLFDKNIVVKTKNYNFVKKVISTKMSRSLNDGVYYYIVFDDNIKLRINKDTYDYFENKIDDEIIIIYKPKANILYDLKISPK